MHFLTFIVSITLIYIISCALWATFAVKMQKASYKEEAPWKIYLVAVLNFIFMPIAIAIAIATVAKHTERINR